MDEIEAQYAARLPILGDMAKTLARESKEALDRTPHVDRIYFRVKDPSHFARKARSEDAGIPRYVNPLCEVEDQVAGRVLVFFRRDIAVVEGVLRAAFRTEEVTSKEPESPKCFDYESRHIVFLIPQHLAAPAWTDRRDMPVAFELQVRTLFMHAWAEPQHDVYEGARTLSPRAERLLAYAAASAWGADDALEHVLDLGAT